MPGGGRSRIFARRSTLRKTGTHQIPEGVGFAAATESTLRARVSMT